MNVWEALQQGKRLISHVSEEGALEAELLLRDCLSLDRTRLFRSLAEEMSPPEERAYQELVRRRLIHEPTAYILGHKEFFGLDFEVSPAAIIPRPETETLVEIAIDFLHRSKSLAGGPLIDVGAGGGAIAVSIASAVPEARIFAIDTSVNALELTRRNSVRHQVHQRVQPMLGDLLGPIGGTVGLIAANLPYVPTSKWQDLPPEIREHEPREGLDGGPDGLQFITRLIREAPSHLTKGGLLLAEIGDTQGRAIAGLARTVFPFDACVEVKRDLAGRDRVLVVET